MNNIDGFSDDTPIRPEEYFIPDQPMDEPDPNYEENMPFRDTEGYDSEGFLLVRVFAANSAYPIPGATITVSTIDGANSTVYAVLESDQSGITPLLTLPCPPRSLSESPGSNVLPYAEYTVECDKTGFYSVQKTNVPIFEGITTIQVFELVPLAQNFSPYQYNDSNTVYEQSTEPSL